MRRLARHIEYRERRSIVVLRRRPSAAGSHFLDFMPNYQERTPAPMRKVRFAMLHFKRHNGARPKTLCLFSPLAGTPPPACTADDFAAHVRAEGGGQMPPYTASISLQAISFLRRAASGRDIRRAFF